MTNKFLFFNFFLYSSSCRCCCCSILLQCSMQYRVIVVNRARSFPFVCRFFFFSPSSVSLSIFSLLCCSRCVHTFTKWMLMPLWHEQLSPSIPNRKRTQEMKANKKKTLERTNMKNPTAIHLLSVFYWNACVMWLMVHITIYTVDWPA